MSKKTGYNTKSSEIGNKIVAYHDDDEYNITQAFNKLIRKFYNKTQTSKFSKQKWYSYFRKKDRFW